jgi:hypothetical protein
LPEVCLTNGETALVDEDDYDRVVAVGKWSEQNGYAVRQIRVGGRKGPAKRIWMHRFVLDVTEQYPVVEVDHVNHDGLDNRKANLRKVTKSENQRGRARNVNKRLSSYKGVFYDPSPRGKKPWRVRIRVDGVLECFGRYATEEEAAEIYDRRASELFGGHARLNLKGVA